MKTKQVYYQDPYKKDLECKILSIEPSGNLSNMILDQTIFYPEGGGQPCDTGTIAGENGSAKIGYVRIINSEIIHQGKVEGELKTGDSCSLSLDWSSRYKYMRTHSAGHLLHDVLLTIFPKLIPLWGGHGKKAFLEYGGVADPTQKELIEQKASEYLQKELQKECQFIPSNLPKDKLLRMIKNRRLCRHAGWRYTCKIYKGNWEDLDHKYNK